MVLRCGLRLEFDYAGDAEAPRLGGRHHFSIALEKLIGHRLDILQCLGVDRLEIQLQRLWTRPQ
jgi:hypothetical protein